MATKALKVGTDVKLIAPVIQGKVVKPEVNGEDFGYMVDYKGADGEMHQRFFAAHELEVVEPEATTPAASA